MSTHPTGPGVSARMRLIVWIDFAELGLRKACVAFGLKFEVEDLFLGDLARGADAYVLDSKSAIFSYLTTRP